jgi:type VI secretion system protein ImpG
MSDELLPYYNRELSYIRKLGAEFAKAYPKIAGRLRLNQDSSDDPHVARMIEAFAYLTARIRHKLDDDFPELSDAFLNVVYPHYLAPVPSMAIVQFHLDPAQGELTSGYVVERGAIVETDAIDGDPCRFRTCYPTTLWPIKVVNARLESTLLRIPETPFSSQTASVLRIQLRPTSPNVKLGMLQLQSLRFFLHGQSQHTYALYELLINNSLGIAVTTGNDIRNPTLLGRENIRHVGFERDEGLLPYSGRSFVGYRLLTEFFAFPEKFLFFEVKALSRQLLSTLGDEFDVYVYLNRTKPDLERSVTADMLRLGCAPIVNLHRQRAEPISLSHTETEYRIVPDARRPLAHEVYSIERVTATSPSGEPVEFRPFYSAKHAEETHERRAYWYATRRRTERYDRKVDTGTEVYLTLVDLSFQPAAPGGWTVDVETTCCNRDLPSRLPFGGGQPHLQLTEGGPVARVECLTPPTPTRRPALKKGAVWRLISHLSLNHLSITDQQDGAYALREILKLYDYANTDETRSLIAGVLKVESRRVAAPVPGPVATAFCRGVEVRIEFDEDRYAGSGLFLFACVLERFLGVYVSLNSFARMIATTKQAGEFRRWGPRVGERILL